MKQFYKSLCSLGIAAGGTLLTLAPAQAMNGPTAITIDGGPLGQLQLSGGADGYVYGQTGTANSSNPSASVLGDRDTGANLAGFLIGVQKTSGILQFTLDLGTIATPSLGVKPPKVVMNLYRASPIYYGYITIAPPNSPITISVGQLPGLEGYECGYDWSNQNIFTSDIWYVENGSSVGVEANYAKGPVSVTVEYGDGWDTRVFNFVQALGTYNFNANNNLNIFYAGNLGRTGLNATTYDALSVNEYGANYINSQMYGAWYNYTRGNLNLIPELQYVYAKADQQVGIQKYTANFGAQLLIDYNFGTSPYSLGGKAEYFTSTGNSYWYIAPHAEGIDFEITPTWQYKNLFVRASGGYVHLLNHPGTASFPAYGAHGTGENAFQGALEAGVLF